MRPAILTALCMALFGVGLVVSWPARRGDVELEPARVEEPRVESPVLALAPEPDLSTERVLNVHNRLSLCGHVLAGPLENPKGRVLLYRCRKEREDAWLRSLRRTATSSLEGSRSGVTVLGEVKIGARGSFAIGGPKAASEEREEPARLVAILHSGLLSDPVPISRENRDYLLPVVPPSMLRVVVECIGFELPDDAMVSIVDADRPQRLPATRSVKGGWASFEGVDAEWFVIAVQSRSMPLCALGKRILRRKPGQSHRCVLRQRAKREMPARVDELLHGDHALVRPLWREGKYLVSVGGEPLLIPLRDLAGLRLSAGSYRLRAVVANAQGVLASGRVRPLQEAADLAQLRIGQEWVSTAARLSLDY